MEELAALPIVKVFPSGKYTGTQLKLAIRTLRGLLDQGIPSKELEVSGSSRLGGVLKMSSYSNTSYS